MNLFETYVTVGLKDEASAGASQLTQTLGNGLKKAAGIGLAAVGAASAGMVALTKNAIEEYAEYEQLVGGVETLFKESADIVMEYASQAYRTAGLSANAYMSTVTSFAASLIQSLGDDTEAAADLANQALTDMSDNANKMGTDMSMIQNAYQGFAKANYTMLDNLKLGYGGTQTEMRRLIRDAAALDDSIDASSMSFANIVKAINVVQTELGITGTTSKEAASTIAGSANAARAAWSNLVAGFADENANMEQLTTEFVDSVIVAGQNLVPRIAQVGETVVGLVKNYGKVAWNYTQESAGDWWNGLNTALGTNIPNKIDAAGDFVASFLEDAAESVGDPAAQEKMSELVVNIGKTIVSVQKFGFKTYNAGRELVLNFLESAATSLTDPSVIDQAGRMIGEGLRGMWDSIQSSYLFGFLEDVRKTSADAIHAILTGDFDSVERYKEKQISWGERAYEGNKSFFEGISDFFSSIGSGFRGEDTNININVTSDGTSDSNDIGQTVAEALQDIFNRRALIYG